MNIRQVMINGRRWFLRRKKNLHSGNDTFWGHADYTTAIITIDTAAKEETLLDTRIHEFTHGFFDSGNQPLLHEDTVTRFATELGMYLWRHGYRCPEDSDWGEEKL